MRHSDVDMTELTRRLVDDADIEDTIDWLHGLGLSKGEAIHVLQRTGRFTGPDPKKLVHFSRAWSHVRERDERFHDKLFRLIDRCNRSESGESEASEQGRSEGD